MPIIFAGVLLGFILLFFFLAWASSIIVLVVPIIMLVVIGIQTFLKIRDRNVDN